MVTRRESLKLIGAAGASVIVAGTSCSARTAGGSTRFRYCLNTSTIRGQGKDLRATIEVAARAGYDGVELWIDDIKKYADEGNSLATLSSFIRSNGLTVDGAIGFAPWIVDDLQQRQEGLKRMEEEMNLVAELDCKRIAAPPAGFNQRADLDYQAAGERYAKLLELGRKTGVMPQLEFWGASLSLYNLGQALMIAAAANDPDVGILADVYHLFRGGSGFNSLKIIDGNVLELFHMNDYPAGIPREEQTDAHRVYPGDGAAPWNEIITRLDEMGGVKVLSLELFNRDYWKLDALEVASTGLEKMKRLVELYKR
jgi:2-keto-myo-inositol isomerase